MTGLYRFLLIVYHLLMIKNSVSFLPHLRKSFIVQTVFVKNLQWLDIEVVQISTYESMFHHDAEPCLYPGTL